MSFNDAEKDMRYGLQIFAVVLLFAAVDVAAVGKGKVRTLDTCRGMYMRGDYDKAADGYRKLLLVKKHRVEAAIGLAEALRASGKYSDAIKALKSVEQDGKGDCSWNVAMAEAVSLVGRYKDALAYASKARKILPTFSPAILIHGLMLETVGREKEAVKVYRSMMDVFDDERNRVDPRSLTALGRIMDRFAVLTGRRASEQAANILNNYFRKARNIDSKYWPAYVASGRFLLTKHRSRLAAKAFRKAAGINKRCVDVHVGMGTLWLKGWKFEKCMAEVDKSLKINPHHPDTLLLKASCLMQWRKYRQVAPVIERVLKTNPNHLEALSLMAAVHVRMYRVEKAKPYIERVGKINPRYAGLPNMIGQWLAAGRQYHLAEKYYKRAIKLSPNISDGYTNLGRMYMQTGDENLARTTLAKAAQIDDYRADVKNYLHVLKELEGFLVKETEHFIVKVSPKRDAVLLGRMSAYMEKVYDEVCGDFGHEPPVKTMVEIFPTHAGFSKRISGRGWIGTIGACTGRVIAMVAPSRRRGKFGTFNWPGVLRHEFTHTVTLSATKNRIPHWFTEACAVWEQPDRRNYDAVRRLVAATRTGRLFPVKELDWGFVRPKRRGDRGLAYAQSEWILEYIIATKGHPTVIKMLEAFCDAWPQERVFKDLLDMTESEFDKTFHAWAKKEIEKWGFDSAKPLDFKQVAAAVKKNPANASTQANLAVVQINRGKLKSAEEAAKKALKIEPDNVKAMGVIAIVLMRQKKLDEAIKTANRLEKLDSASRIAPRVLAQCYIAKKQFTDAIKSLETLKFRRPLDPYSYTQLAKLCMKLGRREKALPNLIELHRRTMTDPKYARQVAEIYGTMSGKEAQALEFWNQVTNINPYEPAAYKAMTEIHINASRFARAVTAAEELCMVASDLAESWTYLAIARYRLAKATKNKEQLRKARLDAKKALKIDPDFSKAQDILDMMEE